MAKTEKLKWKEYFLFFIFSMKMVKNNPEKDKEEHATRAVFF